MKSLLLLFALFIIAEASTAQQGVTITGSYTSNLKPRYAKGDAQSYDTIHLHLQLTGSYDTLDVKKNGITLQVQNYNLANHPILANSGIAFPEAVWPGNRRLPGEKLDTVIVVLLLSGNMRDTLQNDEEGHIIISGKPDNYHTIRFTNTAFNIDTRFQPNKPFWVEVGSNFDLVDGLQANNFFSGVFFHKRDVRPVFRRDSARIMYKINALHRQLESLQKNGGAASAESAIQKNLLRWERIDLKKHNNLGIFAGIFESKSLTNTTEEKFSFRNFYDTTSFPPNKKDSINVYRGVGTYTTQTVVRNVSLFFSPQLRLTNGSANADGLHIFASLWVELQWQKLLEEKVFSQIRVQDTTRVQINDLNKFDAKSASSKHEIDIRSHYIGIGLPLFYRETFEGTNIHLLVNPVFGLSNQPTKTYFDTMDTVKNNVYHPERQWLPFYIVQFRLNEEKYGVSVTGELRELLRRDNPPFVTLALTKKFDLTKFIEFK